MRDKLGAVLSVNDSPRKIAFSFAVGIFIGMSPFLGLHTVIGVLVALIFRLNKFVTIVGVYITNPWTIVPIYTFATWFGARLLGMKKILPAINWNDISLTYLLKEMEPLLWPFVFGTTLLGVLSSLAGYLVVYHAVRSKRKMAGE